MNRKHLGSSFWAGAACVLSLGFTTACDDVETGPEPGTSPGPISGDLCQLEPTEVAIVGDSYVSFGTSNFVPELQALARANGALGASEQYIDHSFPGASMNGALLSIPAQLPNALNEARSRGSSVKLLIADGGGNDVLVSNRSCLDFPTAAEITQQCKDVVQAAIDAGDRMFKQAAAEGVEAVIFFFYPHLPALSLGGGPYPNTILDYAYPLVRESCESQTGVDCYFVDMRPAFDNGSGFPRDGLISIDGIHPTAEGSKILAQEVWQVMQDNCLASE